MSITVKWFNDEHKIVHWDIEGAWNWDDVYLSLDEANALLDTVDHTVHTIVDVRNSPLIPGGTITQLKNLVNKQHPQAGISVFVTTNTFARSVFMMFSKLTGKAGERFRLVATPEEALTLIAAVQDEWAR
jgi:hypothetical protein